MKTNGIVILGIIFLAIIALLGLILLLSEYRGCFSKDIRVKTNARLMYKKQWIITLIIVIFAIWGAIALGGYLASANWNIESTSKIS
ncbi:hypothetical protein V2E25_01595 [Mycoplasmopsis arginini]|uniref:Uncharacterized protein n=1 Tax=Mycoplasmopsis arginini TaxID=2094 RepID=A0ABZ2AMK6_MYCAR|nr:conjugal transfer protein [Mycoplasmopsis arginini]WVN22268.1 hypothetical protein V2E25_01595 [Mycoplasmopsis arginini]VEU81676.1 Uncharacterised protein [Mycoplasmopsis arginini]